MMKRYFPWLADAPTPLTRRKGATKEPTTPESTTSSAEPRHPKSPESTPTSSRLSARSCGGTWQEIPPDSADSALQTSNNQHPRHHSPGHLPTHGHCQSHTRTLLPSSTRVPEITLTTPDTENTTETRAATLFSECVRNEDGKLRSGLVVWPQLLRRGKKGAKRDTRTAFFPDESPATLARIAHPKSPLQARSPTKVVGGVPTRVMHEGRFGWEDVDVPEMFLCAEQEREARALEAEGLPREQAGEGHAVSSQEDEHAKDQYRVKGIESSQEEDDRGRQPTRVNQREKRIEDSEASDSWKRRGRSRSRR